MTATDVFATFARAWNAADGGERLRLLTAACAPDAVVVSPQGCMAGIGAISASIAQVRRAFPAATVSFGRPDEHGGFARVAWTTRWNNGQPPLTGEDFAQFAADGRIQLLVSFDGAPASQSPLRPIADSERLMTVSTGCNPGLGLWLGPAGCLGQIFRTGLSLCETGASCHHARI